MLGFFDSGFGGLQTMKYFKEKYPEYEYLFLADSKNCPYGEKDGKTIEKLTFTSLHRLFDHGAKIVILACNTAAAYAIRERQKQYPNKKVLSITIPGVEKIIHNDHIKGNIGILATQATILSNIYTDLFFRFGGDSNPDFQFVMAPKLVNIIEKGMQDEKQIDKTIKEYLSKFGNISHLILGCTHFPVLMDYFKKNFSGEIIDPSQEAADKFGSYLEHHPEIKRQLKKGGTTQYYTTGNKKTFSVTAGKICGTPINAKHATIKDYILEC